MKNNPEVPQIITTDDQNIIIYNSPDGEASVALYAKDGTVWMNQKQIAELFATSVPNVSTHISNILQEKELEENSVVKDYLTTAADGKEYSVSFYSLDMILAIGFRVRSSRGTQFRIWANRNLKEYMVKGFVMDDERLKNPDGRPDYFDELLERIRDIRASEKRFYQKLRDLFSLSSDYDKTDKATQMFFAETQNKLIFAATGKTAAELIVSRADADKPNMTLTSWKGTIVRKQDIFTAKNYLTEDEIDTLNRLVVIFLETAELRVKDRIDMTLDFWRENVDRILNFSDKKILTGAGKISTAQMEEQVREIYEHFDKRRKVFEAKQENLREIEELEELENQIEHRKMSGSDRSEHE
ncbi:MAG TPA: hydroxyacid dehydrogenase [Phycisphaerales bacterium]|nr:hydroxyacid dehydrogenase [Phycisphaerales bacterium]